MLQALNRSKNRAFTLLELIVVIVILGLLATMSVPTFKNIIDKSKLNTDIASMQALARAEIATAAFGAGVYNKLSVEDTITSVRGGSGLWSPVETSSEFGEVAFKIGDTNTSLQLVTLSSTAKDCIVANINGTSPVITVTAPVNNTCSVSLEGETPETPEVPDAQAPSAPTGLNVTLNETDGLANLTWAAVSNATGYKIFNGTTLVTEVDGNASSMSIAINEGETLNLNVVAFNAAGDSNASEVVSITRPEAVTYAARLTVNTALPSCNGTFGLPLPASSAGTVDWGDGTSHPVSQTKNHTYATPGVYNVTFVGTSPSYGASSSAGASCLQSVEELNAPVMNATSLTSAFQGARNLTTVSNVNTTGVKTMNNMFANAANFNSDLSNFDTSEVTNMASMFNGASSFDSDLDTWDTSQVKTMNLIFNGATSFNGKIGTWDLGEVTNMTSMLYGASSFNQDVSLWSFPNANSLVSIFNGASSFNQDISGWDISNVSNLGSLFRNASSFNQDISGWNTSSVTTVSTLMQGATSFNQNLSGWDMSKVTGKINFDDGATSWEASNKLVFP